MSESVNYKPTVTVGSIAGKAILAAAEIKAVLSDAPDLLKELEHSTKWLSTCQRESLLQESMQDNFERLSNSNLAGSNIVSKIQDFLKIMALTKALDSVSNLSAMVKAEHGQELKNISDQCSDYIQKINSKTVTSDTTSIAYSLNTQLRQITADAHQKLAKAEESALRNIVNHDLKSLGFKIQKKMGALRATKGTTCIWTQIDQKSRMSLDVSGFSGLSCQKEIMKFEKELAAKGISLNRESFKLHGNNEGGDLTKKLSNFFGNTNENKTSIKDQKTNSSDKNVTTKIKSTTKKRQKRHLKIRG